MLAIIKTFTCYCGEETDRAFEFLEGTSEEDIELFASELAEIAAVDFGTYETYKNYDLDEDDCDEDEDYELGISYDIECLEEKDREKLLEEYGEIIQVNM